MVIVCQGGLIVTGVISLFAVLATGLPVVPVPQTNSVTYITRIASRFSGISAAIWLFILGVFPKVMAFVFSEIPVSVRGGIFTIVSATVILTGFKVRPFLALGDVPNRRFRFCVTCNGIVVQVWSCFSVWPSGCRTYWYRNLSMRSSGQKPKAIQIFIKAPER